MSGHIRNDVKLVDVYFRDRLKPYLQWVTLAPWLLIRTSYSRRNKHRSHVSMIQKQSFTHRLPDARARRIEMCDGLRVCFPTGCI